ncbi:MAG: hypothetical protein KGL90_10255 [Burkholderiales bacterium]|nr:hypothetical protein [Burkholderiales bacterium]
MTNPYSQKNIGQGAAPTPDADGRMRLVAPIHLRTSTSTCWKCHSLTQVHALVATDVVDLGESGQCRTYVHGIASPPTELTSALRLLAPNLRVEQPGDDGVNRLTNHCPHCGALQSDVYLFAEPGGPFFGRPPEGHLGAVILEHDIQVDDASYST